jgi:hypothetical protein
VVSFLSITHTAYFDSCIWCFMNHSLLTIHFITNGILNISIIQKFVASDSRCQMATDLSYRSTYLYSGTLPNALSPLVRYFILQICYPCKFIQLYNMNSTAAIIIQIDCTYHVSIESLSRGCWRKHNETRHSKKKIDLTHTA